MTRRMYSLEARDRTGVFMGLSLTDCALIGGGLVATVLALTAGVPALAGAVPLVVGTMLAKLRIGGRPLREWAPLLGAWVIGGVRGRREWRVRLPLWPGHGSGELPPVLADVEIRRVPWAGGELAAVCDARGGRASVVMPVSGGQFGCQDPDGQDVLVAGWGDVLGSTATAGSPVSQIGWSETASVSGLAGHRAWAEGRLAAVGSAVGDAAGYRGLAGELEAVAAAHETVVWITVAGDQVRDVRGRPLERALAHLPAEVENFVAALAAAGLTTDGPLGAEGLWRLLRSRIDPTDPAGDGRTLGSLARRLGLVDGTNGGPVAMSTAWSQLRVDARFHRSWWIESWPRRPVPGDWLAGFLAAGECRTVSVLHRPIDPGRSQRRIESQMVKLTANRARKEERDRRVTEADVRTEEAVQALEAEIAAGYAEVLYLGLVTVSAPSIDELDAAGRRVEQAARARGLALRVLHGRQDVAWAATLPFGLCDPSLVEVMGL